MLLNKTLSVYIQTVLVQEKEKKLSSMFAHVNDWVPWRRVILGGEICIWVMSVRLRIPKGWSRFIEKIQSLIRMHELARDPYKIIDISCLKVILSSKTSVQTSVPCTHKFKASTSVDQSRFCFI